MLSRAVRKGMLHSYKINHRFSIKLGSEPKLMEVAGFVSHWIRLNFSIQSQKMGVGSLPQAVSWKGD